MSDPTPQAERSEHRPAGQFDDKRSFSLPAKVVVTLRAGALLALANIVCVVIFSLAWMHVRGQTKSISVTGSAKKELTSDLIVWKAIVSVTDPALPAAYERLSHDMARTLDFLKGEQVADSQITVSSIETRKYFFRDENRNVTDKIAGYELRQTIEVTSGDVRHIADVGRKITGLIKDGVMVESQPPEYLYTKLADLKITMLAEATRDAATRAGQIAGNSGAKLGPVINARMGVMQINAIHENNVSDSGNNDTSSYEKEITAVVTAQFEVK